MRNSHSAFRIPHSSFSMSLYRKYRPQTFEEVVGQEHIAQTLRNALLAGRTGHAYLFCGPRGTGKTTTARLLAKCLNCENGPTAVPCNTCDFCTRVRDNQTVMDLVEIDAASNTGVDNVRENIIEKVNVAPAMGRYRVYIIDEVHMLSTSSFNALLKTLEEPPPHAVFVLATTDSHKVPATIVSRCQRFDFRRVGPSDIVGRLQLVAEKEGIALSEDAAKLMALTADGALRDALTLLEQVAAFSPEDISEADVRLVLGTISNELLHALIEAVAERDAGNILRQIEAATEAGASFAQLSRDLVNYGRDLLLLTVGFESSHLLSDEEKKFRNRISHKVGRARLMQFVELLRAAEKEMRQSTDHRLLLELALVRAGEWSDAPPAAPSFQPAAAVPVSRPAVAMPTREAPREAPRPAVAVPTVAAPVPPPEPIRQPPAQEMPPQPEYGAPAEPVAEMAAAPAGPAVPAKKGRRIHNMDEFHELWPAVLVRVKKKIGITAVAYLHDAHPVALDEHEAVLEFKKEFHFAKAQDAAKRLNFEQVFNECMASPRRLVFRLAQPEVNAPPPVVEEPKPTEDDDFGADIHTYAQELFAAEVVGRSGEG